MRYSNKLIKIVKLKDKNKIFIYHLGAFVAYIGKSENNADWYNTAPTLKEMMSYIKRDFDVIK